MIYHSKKIFKSIFLHERRDQFAFRESFLESFLEIYSIQLEELDGIKKSFSVCASVIFLFLLACTRLLNPLISFSVRSVLLTKGFFRFSATRSPKSSIPWYSLLHYISLFLSLFFPIVIKEVSKLSCGFLRTLADCDKKANT